MLKNCIVPLLAILAFCVGKITEASSLEYEGSATCGACHQEEFKQWQGSHHDLAMQEATETSVLGDFNNASLTHFGVTSRFFKRDKQFFINTQGPDGSYQDYPVAYTFGFEPLQQYLIAFPDGRYQAFYIAWDSRPKEEGGQKWYHLHPDEAVPYDDSLHWTGTYYNWNSRCAECHSTDLKKNYSLEDNQYQTSWFEINVGCEACHGPGSQHLQWAKSIEDVVLASEAKSHQLGKSTTEGSQKSTGSGASSSIANKGLTVDLADAFEWSREKGSKVASPHFKEGGSKKISNDQIETCAPCHSRRSEISPQSLSSASPHGFDDNYQLQTLQENLYHADGQILDEVYVYGSFLQSKMHQKGVKCSNCHNPHTLKLKVEGNGLCTQCHNPDVFDTEKHHHHDTGSTGAQCVNCHMPETTYMVVDDRRDHSLRVSRPDLSEKIGSPNACNQCHNKQSSLWATDAVSSWLSDTVAKSPMPHYGEALFAGRTNGAKALQLLTELATNPAQPAIVRASGLELLQAYPSQEAYQAAVGQLKDKNAMVRAAAIRTLEFLPPQQRWQVLSSLLDDKVKLVRLEAARVLSVIPASMLDEVKQAKLDKGIAAYIEAQLVSADMPSAHLNLGIIYLNRGKVQQAEEAYLRALSMDQGNLPAMMNLADLYRSSGQDSKGMDLLFRAEKISPENPSIQYAIGLAYVRKNGKIKPLAYFKKAAELAPQVSHYSYTYALALDAAGQKDKALAHLHGAYLLHPRDREILYALATMSRDRGNTSKALSYANKLLEVYPGDQSAARLQQQLRQPAQ